MQGQLIDVSGVKVHAIPYGSHAQPLARLLPDAALISLDTGGHMPHHTQASVVIDAITQTATRAGLR